MSYIVAFVSFSEPHLEYPVQCFRDDLIAHDDVIVRRSDGVLRHAKINKLRFLNWNCGGRIECKVDECSVDNNGAIILPEGSPLASGILTPGSFIESLQRNGWIPVRTRRRSFVGVLANTNYSHTAYIFVRKNGVDIHIIEAINPEKPKPYSSHNHSWGEGKIVRHFLAHTKFNLYDGLLRFSNSFLNNEEKLDQYFISQGLSDKRTDELRKLSEAAAEKERQRNINERDVMVDIYEALSDGSGHDVYLSDGIWLSADGSSNDRGR